MSDEMTTLAVPKEFAENLRQEYKGGNDLERLQDWADASKDPVDGTVYYRNLETGDLEYIGRDGEWVQA